MDTEEGAKAGAEWTADPGTTSPAGAQGEDTWEELGRQLNELGAAITAAVKAAADDPENRRRARELKEKFEIAAGEVGDAFSEAFSSESGQKVKEAAGAVAAAGRQVAEDVRPHLINVTRKAGEALRHTASRLEEEFGDSTGSGGTDGRG